MTVQQSPQATGSGDCFFLLQDNRAQDALQTTKCRSELTYRNDYYYNSNSKFYDLRGR